MWKALTQTWHQFPSDAIPTPAGTVPKATQTSRSRQRAQQRCLRRVLQALDIGRTRPGELYYALAFEEVPQRTASPGRLANAILYDL